MPIGPKTPAPARKRVRGRNPKRKDWIKRFFVALSETSNVSRAAEQAGITVSHVYKVRRSEPEFAHQWQIALCEGYDNLELELLHRLRGGEEPAASGRKFDNAIAFRLLGQHRESVSRQRAIQANQDVDMILERINVRLELMRDRAIAAGEYRDDAE